MTRIKNLWILSSLQESSTETHNVMFVERTLDKEYMLKETTDSE